MKLKLPKSKRYRISIYTMISLMVIGILGFIYDPMHIDNLGAYMIATVMPIIGYVLGESFRPSPPENDYNDDLPNDDLEP